MSNMPSPDNTTSGQPDGHLDNTNNLVNSQASITSINSVLMSHLSDLNEIKFDLQENKQHISSQDSVVTELKHEIGSLHKRFNIVMFISLFITFSMLGIIMFAFYKGEQQFEQYNLDESQNSVLQQL